MAKTAVCRTIAVHLSHKMLALTGFNGMSINWQSGNGKEEAQKMAQLKSTYGAEVRFGLFLCGYFDSGYLGYEVAEGIDWVWEHRMDDLALFGL
jgi:hypothetical protein